MAFRINLLIFFWLSMKLRGRFGLPCGSAVWVASYRHHITVLCDLEQGGISGCLINHVFVARRWIHLQKKDRHGDCSKYVKINWQFSQSNCSTHSKIWPTENYFINSKQFYLQAASTGLTCLQQGTYSTPVLGNIFNQMSTPISNLKHVSF